ncbi:MAG: polysaccharide deacetylase family protein [Clostridiales bacterium]|jgi:hypothetical protein|nr:polysaccharide deacetylase family protein [Clostridiales bacterium]
MWQVQYTYPGGCAQALTFSYDDGTVHDRRLADIFNRAGLRGTFHLNAGTLDTPGKLTRTELTALFEGHEIAAHTLTHPYPSHQPREVNLAQLVEDRRQLEAAARKPVRGLSYPFGDYAGGFKALAFAAGIDYARTVESHGTFAWPEDFLLWHPTCHHKMAAELWEKFTFPQPSFYLRLMYVWGHSYEFENDDNWGEFEEFCQQAGAASGIWFATNGEIMDYILAVRNLRWSVDGTMAVNPSATSVYLRTGGGLRELRPGLNRLAG